MSEVSNTTTHDGPEIADFRGDDAIAQVILGTLFSRLSIRGKGLTEEDLANSLIKARMDASFPTGS